jgi:hypothetical protein
MSDSGDMDYNILDKLNKEKELPEIVQYNDEQKDEMIISKGTTQKRVVPVNRIRVQSKVSGIDQPDTLIEVMTLSSSDLQVAKDSLYNEDGDLKSNAEIVDNLNGGFRSEQIYNEALIYGINSGLYKKMYHYKKLFESPDVEKEMDNIFVFKNLMLANGRVQPAIVLESNNILIKEDNLTTRSIKQSYIIEEQAKVVTTEKNWRDYILTVLTVEKPEIPHALLLPRNKEEQKEWEKAVKVGWVEGEQMASDSLILKLRTLGNDMLGMIRYHLMLQQNIISTPMTYETPIAISKSANGESLNVGETILKIGSVPKFNGNADSWVAIPQIKNLIMVDKHKK